MAQLWAGRSGGRGRQRPAGEAVGVGQRAPAPPGIGEVPGRSLGTGDVGVATGGAAGVPGPHEALSLGVHGFGGLQSGRPGHLQKMLRMEASPRVPESAGAHLVLRGQQVMAELASPRAQHPCGQPCLEGAPTCPLRPHPVLGQGHRPLGNRKDVGPLLAGQGQPWGTRGRATRRPR